MSTSLPNSDSSRATRAIEDGRLLAGRYRLLEKIGEGGAAEVFRATDERLDRVVAVKLLRPQFVSDPAWRKRFEIEAKAAAGLSHPNIVDVYDFGEGPDGTAFIAMQYVEGQNLMAVLRKRGRMSPPETIAIACQVCDALFIAHSTGLIHRDVKPPNILINSQGNARLADFGIVKALSGPTLTQTGMTFGTAAYLSPEQATGASIGPASDIYALGCVMYEMLSGAPPFVGDNPMVVAYKQVWEQPRPLHEVASEVPPSLESVVMRCLNKDPAGRYPTAQVLALDLKRAGDASNHPTQQHLHSGASIVASPGAGAGEWTASRSSAPTEVVRPVAVPPVRVQTSLLPGVSHIPQSNALPDLSTMPYVARLGSNALAVNVSRQRSVRWLPLAAILALLSLGLLGFVLTWGKLSQVSGVGISPPPNGPTGVVVSQAPELSPTAFGQPALVAPATTSPTALPSATLPPSPTDTSVPATEIPPTGTPLPTVTPLPPSPSPTDTPLPPPPPTNTPPPPPAPTDTPLPLPPVPEVTNTSLPIEPPKPHKPKSTPLPHPTNTPTPPPPATDTPLPPPPPPATDTPVIEVPTAAVSDLERVVDEAIAGNPKAVADYLGGKKTALLTLLHDIWEKAKGKIDINVAREVLLRKLEELRHKP